MSVKTGEDHYYLSILTTDKANLSKIQGGLVINVNDLVRP